MKATKLLVAGVAIMSAGLGLSGSVGALTELGSTAEVEVTPGELSLESVPNFEFENVSAAAIYNGPQVASLNSGVPTVTPAAGYNGNNNLETIVADLRNPGSQWELSVAFSQFARVDATGPAATLTGISMTLAPDSDITTPNTVQIPATNTSTLVANPTAVESSGENTINFSQGGDNFISIEQQAALPGVYHSRLTWTLSDVMTVD